MNEPRKKGEGGRCPVASVMDAASISPPSPAAKTAKEGFITTAEQSRRQLVPRSAMPTKKRVFAFSFCSKKDGMQTLSG